MNNRDTNIIELFNSRGGMRVNVKNLCKFPDNREIKFQVTGYEYTDDDTKYFTKDVAVNFLCDTTDTPVYKLHTEDKVISGQATSGTLSQSYYDK